MIEVADQVTKSVNIGNGGAKKKITQLQVGNLFHSTTATLSKAGAPWDPGC